MAQMLSFPKKISDPHKPKSPNRLCKSEIGKALYVKAAIAPGGTGKLSGPYDCLLDSGDSSFLTIPIPFLEQNDIPFKVIGKQSFTLADGSTGEARIAKLDIQIVLGVDSPVLIGVEAALVEDGDEVIIGMQLLNYYDFSVSAGKLVVFKPNEKKFLELEQWSPSVEKKRAIGFNEPVKPLGPVDTNLKPKKPETNRLGARGKVPEVPEVPMPPTIPVAPTAPKAPSAQKMPLKN